MSERGSYYSPVLAMEVKQAREGDSGGYHITNGYINWTTTGITNRSWPIGEIGASAPNNPFEGMNYGITGDLDDIQWVIQNDGNLDRIFRDWGNKYDMEAEDKFLAWAKSTYGYTDSRGCIGDQLY